MTTVPEPDLAAVLAAQGIPAAVLAAAALVLLFVALLAGWTGWRLSAGGALPAGRGEALPAGRREALPAGGGLSPAARADRGEADGRRSGSLELVALFVLALASGAYLVIRTGGRWADSDSAVITGAIRVVASSGHLAPAVNGVYDNGYGYQAVSLAVMAFTGLSVEALQQLAYPMISAILVLPAWVLYRELTGSTRLASLATLFLLVVPEHLFMVLRGSHERVDRAFLLIAIWLLVRSLRYRADPSLFAAHLRLVLLATYGFIATNGLFGVSFVLAISTAWAASWVARRGSPGLRPSAREVDRLLRQMVAATVLLVVVFVVFAYSPIQNSIRLLSEAPGNLLHMILTGGIGVNPYATVLNAWISPVAYLVLSLGEFLLLGGSVFVWLRAGWAWLRGRVPPSSGVWLLWLLYGAFAAQGAMALASDRAGTLSGNLQYRAFAVFATMAAPVVAIGISRWRPPSLLRAAGGIALALAAVAAMLKATNEPAISNKWTFYTAAEDQALIWADTNQRSQDTWVGPDERLAAAYGVAHGFPGNSNKWQMADPPPWTRAFLISDVIRLQDARLGTDLPSIELANLIYDNGQAQVFLKPVAAVGD